jgi:cell wall-associated NlpC family hydrolase
MALAIAPAPGGWRVAGLSGVAYAAADGPYYINATDVNLREKPDGKVLLALDPGDKVYVIKRDGKWAYVSAVAHKKKGWVFDKFLTKKQSEKKAAPSQGGAAKPIRAPRVVVPGECLNPEESGNSGGGSAKGASKSASAASPAPKKGAAAPPGGASIALIGATDVNVRSDASLKSKIVGKVDKGDKLYVVKVADPWYYVSIPSKELKGWVFGEYVNELPRVEIKGDNVRLRETPSQQGRIKSELDAGEVFFKFEQKNGWVLLASSASGLNGWVKAEWVKKTAKAASRPYKITGDQVHFRAEPSVDAEIIASLPQSAEVSVLGRSDKWSLVQYGGKQGYIYSEYLNPNFKHAPKAVYGKSIGDRLIKRAMALKGTPYVWGGESEDGVDCSGLVYKVLCDEGADAANLPRRASTQMAGLGQEVDKEDLLPGDLVFFNTYKPAGHVGIYLGDGNFIHASSAKHQVAIGNLSEGYYKQRFCGARRITEDELKRLQ